MKIILGDLKVKYEGPIKLFCGNNSTISIAHNPFQHDRTKHIEIDRHFIKEKLDSGLIVTAHVPTGLQVEDVFTKGLPATRFQEFNADALRWTKTLTSRHQRCTIAVLPRRSSWKVDSLETLNFSPCTRNHIDSSSRSPTETIPIALKSTVLFDARNTTKNLLITTKSGTFLLAAFEGFGQGAGVASKVGLTSFVVAPVDAFVIEVVAVFGLAPGPSLWQQ
ncbi:Copia protein, partial [Mucuna pruriens]